MYSVQCTQGCAIITTINFRTLSLLQEGALSPLAVALYFFSAGNTPRKPISVSTTLRILSISRKWDHTVCHVLCWPSITRHIFKAHPHPGHISTSSLFVAQQHSIVWRDLCCAFTHQGWMFGLFPFFGCVLSRNRTLGHIKMMVNFLNNCPSIFQRGCTIPTNSIWRLWFLYILLPQHLWFLDSWWQLSSWVWSGSSLWICFSALLFNHVERLFTCLSAICMSSLEKCLCGSFAHFKMGYFSVIIVLW